MRDLDQATFQSEAEAAGVGLSPFRAGLLLAREIAYPQLRPSLYLEQIAKLTEAAAAHAASHVSPETRGLLLADYLFNVAQFGGNTVDYYDPRNSYLNEVLERRVGIPITLSILYLEIGYRLDLPVTGIGLPGHFIVALKSDADEPIYLDPFQHGERLTVDDCAYLALSALGLTGKFDLNWLKPVGPREIVARLLNNLRNFYVQVEDWSRATAVVERLRDLQPATPEHLRDLGLLYYRSGELRRAADCLTLYLRRAPSAPDAATIQQSYDLLLEHLARLN